MGAFAAWMLARFGVRVQPAEWWYTLADLHAAFEAGRETEREKNGDAGTERGGGDRRRGEERD